MTETIEELTNSMNNLDLEEYWREADEAIQAEVEAYREVLRLSLERSSTRVLL